MRYAIESIGRAARNPEEDPVAAPERAPSDESEWQSHFKAGRLGAWTLDLSTGELICSEYCKLNFGRDLAQPFTYKELIDAVHPDDKARMAAAVVHSLSSGEDYDIEYRAMTPSGEVRWVLVRGKASYAKDGAPHMMTGISMDITARRQSQSAVEQSERRYRALFNSIDAGFCILEFLDSESGPMSDCVHVEANAAYARQVGIPDVVGRHLLAALPESADWFETYKRVLLTGEPVHVERWLACSGRHLELSVVRLEPPIRRQVALLVRDVTEYKRTEAALRAALASLSTVSAGDAAPRG